MTDSLQKAKDAGKTRFIAYSGDNDSALCAVGTGAFDTLQTSFNPEAEQQNMGIIVKRPIANAVWGAAEDPNPYERYPTYTEEYFRRGGVMSAEGPLPSEPDDRILTALGFVLAHAVVDVAIVGTQRSRFVESNVEMVNGSLPIASEAVEALHERYDRFSEGAWEQCG